MTPERIQIYRDLLQQPDADEDELAKLMGERNVELSNALEGVEAERLELSNELAANKLELSRFGTPDPADELHLSRVADVVEREINLAVKEGDIPAPIAEGLKGLIRKGGTANGVMLSRSAAWDDVSPIDAVLNLFRGKKIAKTPNDGKVIELARKPEPGASAAADVVTPEREAELRRLANLPPKA